ncbi:MAG: outer membrane protein assembly factor BamA [Elusimicrobiaceae bacterium]|nr:outer membrane protein assembly factor BamA [Elusimicrobiaceae bacterium]
MKNFITLTVFTLLTPCVFSQMLGGSSTQNSLNTGAFGNKSVDFTSGNYVDPEEENGESNNVSQTLSENGPWLICELKTEGLVNINKKTVLKNISAKTNTFYALTSIQEDKNNLITLGNFENVEIDISPLPTKAKNKEDKKDKELYPCHALTVILEEKPILEKIYYEGRKEIAKSSIQKAMMSKIKDPFSESKLLADMDKIKTLYAEKGFLNAQASYTFEVDKEKNIVIVTIKIDEGQKTRVKEVNVEGLNKIPLKKFIKKLKNRPGKVYKVQNVPVDSYKATTFARNEGYYEFKIDDYVPTFSDDYSEVSLKYTVFEGVRARFGETTINGNTVLTEKEIDKSIYYMKGKLYNQQQFDGTVRALQEQYANKGYLRAEVVPQKNLDETNNTLNINFQVQENNIVYVDHIDITGEGDTPKYVFAREVPFKEGSIFNYSKVQRGQNKLMNLGFLNDAQIDITPTNDINKVDIGYNIVEGRPGMFTAGVAMSSLDGLYGDVSISHMNLFHRAQHLTARAMFGKRVVDYTVSWYTPWVFDRPVGFGIDAFDTRRYRPYMDTYSAYTEKRKGFRLNVNPRFNDDIYGLNFSYALEGIKIYDIDSAYSNQEENGLIEGRSTQSTFGITLSRDTRDSIFDATEGSKNSINLELTGGPFMGNVDLYRINLKSAYNFTLFNIGKDYPIVLMIGQRAGSVKAYGRTNIVPAYERIFLGGADTVRGYETTGQIGPATGGEIYYIGNIELKFPIAREGRRTMAQLAAFFDIGNSWKNLSDVRFKTGENIDDFKMGVGVGLRIVTPSLPIRLDWGYGLNHKSGEKRGYIYFSMANLF